MRFLVDAQLPPALARWLATKGHEAEHVADRRMEAATDSAIWDLRARGHRSGRYERLRLRAAQGAGAKKPRRDPDQVAEYAAARLARMVRNGAAGRFIRHRTRRDANRDRLRDTAPYVS
jgi:hypothetical protein